MKNKITGILLGAGICTAAVMGTGLVSYAGTNASGAGEQRTLKDDGGLMAKIVSIDDDTLTVTLAERPGAQNADGETPPEKPADGQTPPEKPADGETPPEKPADGEMPPEKPADGETPPERPADGGTLPELPADFKDMTEKTAGGRAGKMEMKFSEETSVVTLSSSTTVTKGSGHESADTAALTEGAVVRIVLDGTTVVSIDIMGETE
ncbi:hypothetical protein [uncultured Clostridium sp.]|uniref:hypothetical protein n=1 Tax=uncultured Clostridium sp. TaxID=59620 RepID=UPI0025D94038|nr:hypothetical protein [uncultured Clostridium sp.]